MKKQFLRTGAVLTAFSLAAGLPGLRTVQASEENIKTFRYEGINYFYTLNEDKEIIWLPEFPDEEEILIPPFVEEDSEPLKEEDLPLLEAEPTVRLIVTEITPEALVFTEEALQTTIAPPSEAKVPEATEADEAALPENENPAPNAAPDIDPTVIPTESELPETAPLELGEETGEEAEEDMSAEETAEDMSAEEAPEDISEEACADDSSAAKQEAPAAEKTDGKPVISESADGGKPEMTHEAEIPAGETTPEEVKPADAAHETQDEPDVQVPQADTEDHEAAKEPVVTEEVPAPEAEEENPLLALGKQEKLQKYDNLIAAASSLPAEETAGTEENPEEELSREASDAENAGDAENALEALARHESGTAEPARDEQSVSAEKEAETAESRKAVIPEAVEASAEELTQLSDVTSVDETIVNAAPGTQQIVGDTDAPGSKTITKAPTAAPATSAPETAAPPAPSGNDGAASPTNGSEAATPSAETGGSGKRSNPKTGDTSTPLAYMAAMIASAGAFLGAKRKKRG